MPENYLKKHIESLFREATSLNANLRVLDNFLEGRGTELKTKFPIPNYDLITMITTYRDLSQLEGGRNLYDTNVEYTLSTDNLSSELERLMSYTACLTLTQVFEVFESFLKNILAEIIFKNPSLIQSLKLECPHDSVIQVRNELYKIQGNSNKGFIKALRKISPFFKKYEENNIWKRNMSHWFEIIAKVRHLIVHSRLIVNSDFEKYVSEAHRLKLFNLHFTITDTIYGKKLVLTAYQANAIIDYLFEYAHLIYKGLSIDFNLYQDYNFKRVAL